MAIRRIHLAHESVLRQVAKPVNRFDGKLQALIDDMFETMHSAPGIGLAAPQVGESVRLFVAEWPEDDEDPESLTPYAIVNPVIEERSDTTEKDIEGCLSIPETRVEVERPTAVTVSGQGPSGEPVRVEAEGLLARIFQHEIDHLDGVLILDRTDRESRKNAMREMRERMMARR